MTIDQARAKVYQLINEHKLHEEMWLALTLIRVNHHVLAKTAGKIPLMPHELKPDLVLKRTNESTEKTAEEILKLSGKYN